MVRRKIIVIDEARCNGCGACVTGCHEGALRIVNGKARLVGDFACDGLGACIGQCPTGALRIEEREAVPYDASRAAGNHASTPCACPGSQLRDTRSAHRPAPLSPATTTESQLTTWPVQLRLVPVVAPFLEGADLLIAADCVPFAYADFHRDLLAGKVLLVGCPKLDDLQLYKEKIDAIVREHKINSITYAHMEVPCCLGLISIIKEAIAQSGRAIPFSELTITVNGERKE